MGSRREVVEAAENWATSCQRAAQPFPVGMASRRSDGKEAADIIVVCFRGVWTVRALFAQIMKGVVLPPYSYTYVITLFS